MNRRNVSRIARSILCILIILTSILSIVTIHGSNSSSIQLDGKIYEFDGKTEYTISDSLPSESNQRYGIFSLMGDFSKIDVKDNIPYYVLKDNNLSFFYNYTDAMLKAKNDEWHLHSDKCSKIDGKKLKNEISKGLFLLQVSVDGINWSDVICEMNSLENTPIKTGSFYSATDIQLMNGCYYRLTVAYEFAKYVGKDGWWIFESDKYDYVRYAEVYEFYAQNEDSTRQTIDPEQVYNIGSMVRTGDYDSYTGSKEISKTDPHYGWSLGNFFLSGQTKATKDNDGNIVILKNVGDKITLWFKMNQDINSLNGNSSMRINSDDNWYDGYFQTERTNSGRGVLIIKHTDYKNETSRPVIYTNYLEANTSFGANTRIQVFEEGDYEVALDYEIKKGDKTYHYRISASFLIRNGNCMVYPLDCLTGGELTNGSLTNNGFTLDYAKSRYLDCSIKKEILTENADFLTEDTRFNKVVKDGDVFTEEGIYTISIKNKYTGAETNKVIYVGNNSILKAHVSTGYPISKIKDLISMGAIINTDGSITIPVATIEPEIPEELISNSTPDLTDKNIATNYENLIKKDNKFNFVPLIIVLCFILVSVILAVVIVISKNRINRKKTDEA